MSCRFLLAFLFLLFFSVPMQADENDSLFAESDSTFLDSLDLSFLTDYLKTASRIDSLKYQTGHVEIGDGLATLNLPEGLKYLNAEDSYWVLSEVWGNPGDYETMGMLFLEDQTPNSDTFHYAIDITFEEEGYVDDKDAADIDYEELLETMQDDTRVASEQRVQMGYEAVELVGWASEPFYDAESKKLHWAKELRFGEAEVNTLNYNIRVLGRRGYLNLNVISDMDMLDIVQEDIDPILASVDFQDGHRYGDFNPDIDQVAAYGIGGLIAGKVLAKAGFFKILLAFLAKGWKFIAIGAVAVGAFLKKLYFGGSES